MTLGLFQYTYSVFLFDKFGGTTNASALYLTSASIAISELFILLTEVPTGAISDYIGRKKTVIASFALAAITFFLRAWMPFLSSTRSLFCLAAISALCFSLSYTFMTGSLVAWIVDTIRVRGIKEGHGPLMARSYSSMFIGKIVGSAVGLWLYLSGYIFYAFALGCIASFVCALYCGVVMEETEQMQFYEGRLFFSKTAQRMKEIIISGGGITVSSPAILYSALSYVCFMLLNVIVGSLWPIAMKANYGIVHMSFHWCVIVFFGAGFSYVGSKAAEQMARYFSRSEEARKVSSVHYWMSFVLVATFVALMIVTLGISELLYGKIDIYLFVIFIALFQFGYGFLSPIYNTLLNNYIPPEHSQERATIMSLGSMVCSFLTMLLMIPSSGPNSESMAIGWLIPSSILIVVMLVLHLLMRRYQRKIGELPLRGSVRTDVGERALESS